MIAPATATARPKATLVHFYHLGRKANCPKCKIPCKARTRRFRKDGSSVQYRYCPICNFSNPIDIPAPRKPRHRANL